MTASLKTTRWTLHVGTWTLYPVGLCTHRWEQTAHNAFSGAPPAGQEPRPSRGSAPPPAGPSARLPDSPARPTHAALGSDRHRVGRKSGSPLPTTRAKGGKKGGEGENGTCPVAIGAPSPPPPRSTPQLPHRHPPPNRRSRQARKPGGRGKKETCRPRFTARRVLRRPRWLPPGHNEPAPAAAAPLGGKAGRQRGCRAIPSPGAESAADGGVRGRERGGGLVRGRLVCGAPPGRVTGEGAGAGGPPRAGGAGGCGVPCCGAGAAAPAASGAWCRSVLPGARWCRRPRRSWGTRRPSWVCGACWATSSATSPCRSASWWAPSTRCSTPPGKHPAPRGKSPRRPTGWGCRWGRGGGWVSRGRWGLGSGLRGGNCPAALGRLCQNSWGV